MSLSEYVNSIGVYQRYHQIQESRIPHLDQVKKYCDNLEQNIKNGKGLLLLGAVGVGKTCIISYIAQKIYKLNNRNKITLDENYEVIISKRYSMQVIRMPSMYNLFFNKQNGDLDGYYSCDILGLDDFGTGYAAEYPATNFENLMELRYAKMRPTIITSNFSLDKLRGLKQYERVIDRWRDMCDVIVIDPGKYKSLRGKK